MSTKPYAFGARNQLSSYPNGAAEIATAAQQRTRSWRYECPRDQNRRLDCGQLGIRRIRDLLRVRRSRVRKCRWGFRPFCCRSALIALVVALQRLAGVTFDLNAGTLRFYSFWLPRRVALADISDANCENRRYVFASRHRLGAMQQRRRKRDVAVTARPGSAPTWSTLSGTFGSRQVRFSAKRWRDLFLSLLRDQAPACRITRWY